MSESTPEDMWKGANPFGPVPDGTYQLEIQRAVREISQSGRDEVIWFLVVLSGKKAGTELTKREGLATAQNMAFFKRSLLTLKLDTPEFLSGVDDEYLKKAQGLRVEAKLAVKSGFQNCYFQKLIPQVVGAKKEAKAEKEDEVPF